MPEVADDEPPPAEHLEAYRADGRLWVAAVGGPTGDDRPVGYALALGGPADDDRPVGYALASMVDGAAHLDQLSVDPRHQRRGLGRRLVDHVEDWAATQGLPALTLSTFTAVPWNGPWYGRLGFTVVPEADWGPGLRRIRERERALGLDVDRRQLMRRPVHRHR